MKAVLVTGGCGFIGSNFIRHILREREEATVINIDKLTYAGNPASLIDVVRDYAPARYRFVKGDISDWDTVRGIFNQGDICGGAANIDYQSFILLGEETTADGAGGRPGVYGIYRALIGYFGTHQGAIAAHDHQ